MPLFVDFVKEIHAGLPFTQFANISPLKEGLKRTGEWKREEAKIRGDFKEALLYLHEFAKAKGIPRFSFYPEAVRDEMEEEMTTTIDSLLDFIFSVPYGGSMEQSARNKVLEQFHEQVKEYKKKHEDSFKILPPYTKELAVLIVILGGILGLLGYLPPIIVWIGKFFWK